MPLHSLQLTMLQHKQAKSVQVGILPKARIMLAFEWCLRLTIKLIMTRQVVHFSLETSVRSLSSVVGILTSGVSFPLE